MEYKIADHIHLKITLAVQAVDDFTNRIIKEPKLDVCIEGEKKPIRKSDGYYVFLNIREPIVKLRITAAEFSDYEEEINIRGLDPRQPVIKVRLKPNRCYSLPEGTTCVGGKAPAGSIIRICCYDIIGYFRLIRDYHGKEDTNICIFNPLQIDIEGKNFCITGENRATQEDFGIRWLQKQQEESYCLKEPLMHSYKKVSARIYPVLFIKADKNGEFFAPVPFLEKEHTKTIIRITNGEQEVELEKELEFGTMNRIILETGGK